MTKFVSYIILLFLFCNGVIAQQNLLPLNTFYRDQLLANKGDKPLNNGSFYPVVESEYDLMSLINDSSKQYYDFTEILFKKHLIEAKGEDYFITISPAINISKGRNLGDTLNRDLFQNTRGIHVEGDLFRNFSFSTSFYENQSRNTVYESLYYASVGELYPKPSGYQRQNAVIPGAGRTKPFKDDGFDYAFAVGYFVYKPIDRIQIRAGNNPQFVGDGYRSVLLSDNSYNAPYFRVDWQINQNFRYSYHRARLFNLLRKPASGSVEAYYEPKGFSVNYLTYMPNDKVSLSLFDGGVWSQGDSIRSKSNHPLFYNPLPVTSWPILKGKNELLTVTGLNLSFQVFENHRVYSQFATTNFNADKIAFQLGYRGYNYFGLSDFMLQLEYNYASSDMYESNNPRLNYSHYNLPLAHTKGNGFSEVVARSGYEYKRAYVTVSSVYIVTNNRNDRSLIAVYDDLELTSENISYTSVELGYRFNRMMNLCVFGRFTNRITTEENIPDTHLIEVGLATPLTNHYRDF